jgi:hypothetical protein
MLPSLLHPWLAPANVPLSCPPPPPGDPPDPTGFFDPATVSSAYHWTAIAVAVLLLALVLVCYLWTSRSLNVSFVRRWYLFWIATMVGAAAAPFVVFRLIPLRALANSCDTNPLAFRAFMPTAALWPLAAAWLFWALVFFPLVSFALTRVGGRSPASGGFFHHQGCPVPRWNPFGA